MPTEDPDHLEPPTRDDIFASDDRTLARTPADVDDLDLAAERVSLTMGSHWMRRSTESPTTAAASVRTSSGRGPAHAERYAVADASLLPRTRLKLTRHY